MVSSQLRDQENERFRSRNRRGRGDTRGHAMGVPVALPHDQEAEEGVIGCGCIDAESLGRAQEAGLRGESFYDARCGLLFEELMALYARRVPIDATVLLAELRAKGLVEAAGGEVFICLVTGKVPSTALEAHHIARVKGLALSRNISRVASEIAERARSVEGEVGRFAAEAEEQFLEATSGVKRGLPEVMRWHELIGPKERPLPPELIKGILFRGSKLMLGGGSKSFKTWVLLDMALSVAAGKPWWGMATVQAPVLFVNFELQDWSFESAPEFYVWNLRGRARDFRELRVPLLNKVRRFKIGLGILDPIYKCLGERDENSNGEVGDLLNEVESVAVDGNCAMVHGHHFAKGDSSEKDKRDLTAGAGAWMRDPDSSIVLRPHEEEDSFTAEFILRDLEARQPMVVRWRHPVMEWMPGADPSALRKAGRPKESAAEDVVKLLGEDQLTHGQWLHAAERRGMSESTFKRRVKEALAEGVVEQNGPLYRRPKKSA
jgi:hypothetical protein